MQYATSIEVWWYENVKRTMHENTRCPVARSLDVIGDWWSLLIVRDTLNQPRRFGELQRSLGVAKNILAAKLKALVADGILTQQPASDGSAFQEYALTGRGRALLPVIVALRDWGEQFLFPEELSLTFVDRITGLTLPPLVVRAADGQPLSAGDTLAIVNDPQRHRRDGGT